MLLWGSEEKSNIGCKWSNYLFNWTSPARPAVGAGYGGWGIMRRSVQAGCHFISSLLVISQSVVILLYFIILDIKSCNQVIKTRWHLVFCVQINRCSWCLTFLHLWLIFADGVDINLVVDPLAGDHGVYLRHREHPRGHGRQDRQDSEKIVQPVPGQPGNCWSTGKTPILNDSLN